MYREKIPDSRTVLAIVFIFIFSGLAVNKPLPSHILLAVCCLYLLEAKAYRECFLYAGLYGIIAVLMFYIKYIPNTTFSLMIVSLSYFIQKFVIAIIMIVFLKKKTSLPHIVSALQTMRCPNIIAIPMIVILRYMPVLKEDYSYLKDSLKIRGVSVSPIQFFIHPIQSLEFLIVPILFRSLRIAEELSASVLLRGMENYKYRTNLYPLKFGRMDMVYMLFTVIAAGIVWSLQFEKIFFGN